MSRSMDAPTPLTTLPALVTGMADRQVLVVGDIMLDRFVYGAVHRISPESPIPVLSIEHENRMLGGAGNVLSNLAGLHVKAHILAVVGDDVDAQAVRVLVAERGANPDGLIVTPDRPTTVKTRFLAAHQQLLRTDFEKTGTLPGVVETVLLKSFRALLPQVDAIVLSDYGKGVLSPTVITTIIAEAQQAGVPVLVDPKKADYSIYKGATIITPNRKELAEATSNLPTKTDDDVVFAARTLMDEAGVQAVLATRSQDGMTLVRRGQEPLHLRTEALEVFDVSGAGDTVIATVAAALAAGADLAAAAALANVAGGLVVAKVGTAPIRAQELLQALDHRDFGIEGGITAGTQILDRVRNAKICAFDEALEIVQRWKARGQTVGFTNGCFDILHPGHVAYLDQARSRCDRLVVAINADDSVKRLKGPERPVNNEDARALVIGALAAVDLVVLFGKDKADDDKPLRLIELLKPDVYFKGGDYTIEQLAEAPLVAAYGGRVELMSHFEGHSTTATITRMTGRGNA